MEKQQTHRPGVFKQTNKSHKHGRHRSKGSISEATKGKVSVKTLSKKQHRELSKQERRNHVIQLRAKKKEEILLKKRSLGGLNNAPFLVGVVPLNKSIDLQATLNALTGCDQDAIVTKSSTGSTHITFPRFKKRFSFVTPPLDNILHVLDVLKVCDTVLFVISATFYSEDDGDMIDAFGSNVLLCSIAQGLPTPVVAVTNLETLPVKNRNDVKQRIQKMINKWLPDEKVMALDNKETDGLNLIRKISNQKQKRVAYRDLRPHLYAEDVNFLPTQGTTGTLEISGFLRGSPMSANDLVHIPGMDDYQLLRIGIATDPFLSEKKAKIDGNGMEIGDNNPVKVIEIAESGKQETLASENVPDVFEGEQTWPTDEEMQTAKEDEKKLRRVKRVPAGWSEYQAAWIPDESVEACTSDSNDEEEEDDEGDESNAMDAMSEDDSCGSEAGDELHSIIESEVDLHDDKYDEEINVHAEKEELVKFKEAKADFEFPDQIDTPLDMPARVRFQKYRGLESFRTTPWDVKENLPSDYARIFQFKNFKQTSKAVLKTQEDKIVMPGWYITIQVKEVSQLLWNAFQQLNTPLIVFGLLPHEHKMSVLNAALKRTSVNETPIKSKEKLMFQCGYRRFYVNPIFSQHTNGAKHKYERFFQPASISVATFYAPIQFPPAPVLCFKEAGINNWVLMAHGNLLSCNPDRLVIKRVILSGHPLKIYKKASVVRFMFFNREDVVYFKPVKLRTQCGRVGHIKEPLGTHGHMKCVFDGQLKSMDSVFLHLYKRVFPKWTYEPFIVDASEMEM